MCLQMKNIFPEIIFLSPPHILQEEMAEQLQVQSIGFNSGHFWEQVDLVIYLSRFKNKLLINLANTGPIFIRSQVITLHDVAVWEAKEYYHPLFSFWYRLMISQLVKKAKLIFTVSETEKLKIVQRFKLSQEHVQVTYNGIANNMLASPLPDNLIKEEIILYVGAITAKKNVHILVEAFSSSNLFKHYKLILVGRESSIMGQAKFQVNDQIIWHKSQSIANYLNNMCTFVTHKTLKRLLEVWKHCLLLFYLQGPKLKHW